jgi:hypothetical protein
MCGPAEPKYVDACLFGARVNAKPPAGLVDPD